MTLVYTHKTYVHTHTCRVSDMDIHRSISMTNDVETQLLKTIRHMCK